MTGLDLRDTAGGDHAPTRVGTTPPRRGIIGAALAGMLASDNQSAKSLQDCLKPGLNTFDLLRLLASLAVIFGHSYALTPVPAGPEPVELLLKFDYAGSLAVKFFFFLSGLLVCHSIIKDPRVFYFLTKRALRIFPALVVCNLVTVLVVGLIFTDLPRLAYLAAPQTWRYLVHNSLLYDFQWTLPGVFAGDTNGLNGSLWTLPKEFDCYLFVAIVCALGVFSRKRFALVCFGTVLFVSTMFPAANPRFNYFEEMYYLPFCFSLGALFAIFSRGIALRLDVAVMLWVLLWLVDIKQAQQFIFYVALFYSLIFVACSRPAVRWLTLPFDASYGVYIYGFLIQQVLFHKLPALGFHAQQIGAMLIALLFGVLSWFGVEKPMIAFGRGLVEGRPAAPPRERSVSR